MAAAGILSIRRRLISPSASSILHLLHTHSQTPLLHSTPLVTPFTIQVHYSYFNFCQRSFSWWSYGKNPKPNEGEEHAIVREEDWNISVPESHTDVQDLGAPGLGSAGTGIEDSVVVENVSNGIGWSSPVDAVIAFIDGMHNVTGLPWWLTIVASTATIRLALVPVMILQMRKMDKIKEILQKLPPPIPEPGSGRTLLQQYTLFKQQRQAMGCPTFLWMFSSFAAQVPCFICWMMAVRRMCLEHHPGFDSGGALWFVDLTEYVHGPWAALFPCLIAGIHLLNVQISFGKFKNVKLSGPMHLLEKIFKIWLQILTVPIFLSGFYIPQGSLVYWLHNGVFTVAQQLSFKNPSIRRQLGLRLLLEDPAVVKPMSDLRNGKTMDQSSAEDLLKLAAQHVAKGHQDRALPLLRAAVEKDPEKSETYIALGKTQLQQRLWAEADENFELAIAKGKNDDILIAAYSGSAVSQFAQGKNLEGIARLRKLAAFEEPEEPWSRHRYYQGLTMLASALSNEGEKVEAAKYLRLAAKYDPSVNIYLRELEGS